MSGGPTSIHGPAPIPAGGPARDSARASARILDGRPLAADLRAEVAAGVRELAAHGFRPPGLAAILVGENAASEVYVASKVKGCAEVGIASRAPPPPGRHLPAASSPRRSTA